MLFSQLPFSQKEKVKGFIAEEIVLLEKEIKMTYDLMNRFKKRKKKLQMVLKDRMNIESLRKTIENEQLLESEKVE